MSLAPELPKRFLPGLRALALLLAVALLPACARTAPGGPFPGLAEFAGREVERVEFDGEIVVPGDSLDAVVTTRATTCALFGIVSFIRFCPFGVGESKYNLDLSVLARDVVRIGILHRDFGYYGTRVIPSVQPSGDGQVEVRFFITPGDQVTLTTLEVTGTEPAITREEALDRIPLKAGEPFRRSDFLASVDTLRNALLDRGHAYAQVLRNFDIDTVADVASARLEASPGPVVTVDTVIIAGNYRLSERTIRKTLALEEGDRLRSSDLARSQRNLFALELVDFAAVEVAPESLQVTPDSAELLEDSIGSTVVVRVGEAARYAVDVAAGYGTVDCLRARGTHTDRNFLGGARRLEISGLIAKVGATGTFGGLSSTALCEAFDLDELSPRVDSLITQGPDFRLAADFRQPRLFGTRTSFLAGAYLERVSELGLYLRESVGGQVGAVRQVARGTILSGTLNAERGSTEATDFFFCRAFEVCRPEDIELLTSPRWTNSLTLTLSRSRVRLDPFPTGGHQFRLSADHASPLLLSDDEYTRVQADGSVYREVGRDWVLQARLMGGTFLGGLFSFDSLEFVPPERKFYGGGPTHVRGFGRNELGPRVYVRRILPPRREGDEPREEETGSSTGGTRTVLATLELTSPPLTPLFRAAFFVDAGQVWSTLDDDEGGTRNAGLRFTPGLGARLATPVGPIRFDVAYNAYDPEPGPLYLINERGEISGPIQLDYRPDKERKLWDRLTFQISIGQAF